VRAEIHKIMGFWLQLGVSGFRMDAVPFLIERKGAHVEGTQDFGLLKEMRDFLQWRSRRAILLAEANVPPDESMEYFGADGERLQMMLNFPVNQRLFYALATADIEPLVWALEGTRKRPAHAQWVQFLRSHDELDLGRLTDEQRHKVFAAFGPAKRMQLYDRGIRRRLAPMLGNDQRHLRLAFSLLFSLPGTPMMQYGDEIGMGDDLRLPERECARTPMQWTADRHAGFSTARRTVRPVIDDAVFGYERVNVANQRRDPQSLLNWTERIIRMRRECPEISWGEFDVVRTSAPEVLALRYVWRDTSLLTLHNFAKGTRHARFKVDQEGGERLVDLFEGRDSRRQNDGHHRVTLEPYGWRWFRLGSADNTLRQSELVMTDSSVR
jgi:maltose alpha-D-glucosyltransferase/alpha-amylase